MRQLLRAPPGGVSYASPPGKKVVKQSYRIRSIEGTACLTNTWNIKISNIMISALY